MDLVIEIVNARWLQRRCNKTEAGLFEEQMVKQKEQLDKTYDSYPESVELSFTFRALSQSGSLATLNRTQSRLERNYTHALRDLLSLQQLRESKRQGAERTQSQQRTPSEPLASASVPSLLTLRESKPPGLPTSLEVTPPRSSDPAIIPPEPL